MRSSTWTDPDVDRIANARFLPVYKKGVEMRKTAAAVVAAVLAAGTAAVSVSAALPAYASSPEFARSAEEWAALKDNKIEYWEIEGLIQEYNPTVQ